MASVPEDQVSIADLGGITNAALELFLVMDCAIIAQRVTTQSGHPYAYASAIGGAPIDGCYTRS